MAKPAQALWRLYPNSRASEDPGSKTVPLCLCRSFGNYGELSPYFLSSRREIVSQPVANVRPFKCRVVLPLSVTILTLMHDAHILDWHHIHRVTNKFETHPRATASPTFKFWSRPKHQHLKFEYHTRKFWISNRWPTLKFRMARKYTYSRVMIRCAATVAKKVHAPGTGVSFLFYSTFFFC